MAKKWKDSDIGDRIPFYPSGDGCPTPGKRTYDNRKDARTVLRRTTKADSQGNLVVYKCPCGGFHVGTRRTGDREDARRVANIKLSLRK